MKSSLRTGFRPELASKGQKAERAERIERIKAELNEQSSGRMFSEVREEVKGSALEESFWDYIKAFENGPTGTHMNQLREAGIDMPASDLLDDEALSKKLWQVINGLAELRVFLDQTDHLDDRALYNVLRNDLLVQETVLLPVHPDSATHLDILGGWSDADNYIYYKYYAADADRNDWASECPEYDMPEHVDLPFDRDLPKAYG